MSIHTNVIYQHCESKALYVVVDFCLTETSTGDWVDGVFYRNIKTGKLFCRPLTTFRERFEEVREAPAPKGWDEEL